jgi:Raf kinase inhibitor-like YbhB/YbcL family protein
MPNAISVQSSLFSEGETIPTSAAHSMAGGQNVSPDLRWSNVPSGTKSLAVTCYDPDAPTTVGFVHWVLFNLDPATSSLPAGAGAKGKQPQGAMLGHTDWGDAQYGGMAPPPGERHRYEFRVYALDQLLELDQSTTNAKLRFMIRGHVLADALLTGLYGQAK